MPSFCLRLNNHQPGTKRPHNASTWVISHQLKPPLAVWGNSQRRYDQTCNCTPFVTLWSPGRWAPRTESTQRSSKHDNGKRIDRHILGFKNAKFPGGFLSFFCAHRLSCTAMTVLAQPPELPEPAVASHGLGNTDRVGRVRTSIALKQTNVALPGNIDG